ncbi:hypothetical protein Bca101_075920 [Brassica carinata]
MQFVQFFLGGKCKYGSTCKFKHSKEGDSTEAMRQDQKRQRTESSYGPSRERRAKTIDKQRREAQNNLQEERLMIPENRNVNAQENLQQQADMERQNREAQEKAQEERRRQIDNERRQARLRLERMKPRVLTSNVDQLREALPHIGIERKEGDGIAFRARFHDRSQSDHGNRVKKDIIVIRGSGTRSVEKAVVRYDRDTRFRDENMEATPDRDPIAHAIYWEKKVQELRVRNAEMKQRRANETIQKQRLRNAEMQQRRANKTESRSIEETKGETVDMRPSGSGEKAVVRYDRDTRFWEDKMEQQRLSDALMQHMRSNEIVSRSTKETKGDLSFRLLLIHRDKLGLVDQGGGHQLLDTIEIQDPGKRTGNT